MRNTIEHAESILACYQLRAVPINVNWRYGPAELTYLFDDADIVAVVHDAEFARRCARRLPRPRGQEHDRDRAGLRRAARGGARPVDSA